MTMIASVTTISQGGEKSFRACNTLLEVEEEISRAVHLGLHHDVRHVPLPADDLERLRDIHRGIVHPTSDIEEVQESVAQYRRLETRRLIETEYSSLGHPPVARVTREGLEALGYSGERLELELAEQEER